MTTTPSQAPAGPLNERRAEAEIRALYAQLIEAWNQRSAAGMAALFAADRAAGGGEGEIIGFDGSEMAGPDEIAATLGKIFADHATAPYVTKVRSVRFLGPDAAVLRAVAGMVPAGHTDINPQLNAHQTLVAAKADGRWRIALFQNTPAQFHGRPDLAKALTDELRQLLA